MIEINERPLCRKVILSRGLTPLLVNGVWNGIQAVDCEGRRRSLSAGMRAQMRKMIREGFWGEIKMRAARGHHST